MLYILISNLEQRRYINYAVGTFTCAHACLTYKRISGYWNYFALIGKKAITKVGALELHAQFILKNGGLEDRFPREASIPLGTCIPIERHYKLGT